jgi:hypothetical protein
MIPEYVSKQIKEYIPCNNPDNQPCFVYEWYNINKDKYYVGYHKGEPFDGYYHSSKDKEFADDFQTCEWRYTIKDFGSESLMLSLENQILSKAKAKDNPKYYNKTNGIPQEFMLPDEELVYDFANQILNTKSLDEIQPVLKSKEDLSNYVEYQARAVSLNADHEQDIKNRIDDSNGAYAQDELLITVLKDRLWEGKVCDLQINGRHSKNAFLKSKTGSYINVLEIPEEKHRHLSTEEVKLLALALNPTTKTPMEESQPEDIVKLIYDFRLRGLTNKSQTIQSILDKFHTTSYRRRKILNEVNEMINEKTSTVNQLWVMYNAGKEEIELQEKVEDENRQPGVYCKSYSTKINDFWKALHKIRDLNEKNPNTIKIFKCIFWHQSKEIELNWFANDMLKNRRFLDHYLNRNGKDGKDGVEVIFEYMPTTRSSTIDNREEVK